MDWALIDILFQYFQKPVVLYVIMLTIAWTLIHVASRFTHREIIAFAGGSTLVVVILVTYILLTLILMHIRVNLFPYLHAVVIFLIFLLIRGTQLKGDVKLLALTLMVTLMPIVVMISTKHPLPLGDDCRFSGFAVAIEEDGRWIPFKYHENTYYQFFHLIPFVEYVLASVTGLGVANIMGYYLTLKFCLVITYIVLVYLVVRKLTRDSINPIIAMLLLSITPPLAFTQVVHQGYAIVLFLATALLMLKMFEKGVRATYLIAMYLLWAVGLVAHATYTLMVITFSLPLILTSGLRGLRSRVVRNVVLLAIVSLTYWIYTYVLDMLIRPGINALTRIMDLLTGQAIPFYEVRQPWYTPELSIFFIAWALVPAIVSSYFLISILPSVLRRSGGLNTFFKNKVSVFGFLALGGSAINFILRTLPTFGGRYFYWLYLLMLPLSAFMVKEASKKLPSLIILTSLISLVSFYGIQDPTLAANTYGDYIGWADDTSWDIGLNLAQYIDPNINSRLDPRIGAPISAIRLPLVSKLTDKQIFVLLVMDKIGLQAFTNDQRSVAFFIKNFNMYPKQLLNQINEENLVLNYGKYLGIWKS